MIFNNTLLNKNEIINNCKNLLGIYLLHNLVKGKQYIGSSYNLSVRFFTYYYLSRLIDKKHISNSFLKYGHDNFSVVILDILGIIGSIIKTNLIKKRTILYRSL
jgi:group I intron endonuclease